MPRTTWDISLTYNVRGGEASGAGEVSEDDDVVFSNSTVADNGGCFTIPEIYLFRRHFDMAASVTGVITCTAHLALLLYIKYAKKGRSYELLIAQAVVSLVALWLLVIGCMLDLCLVHMPLAFVYFRAHLWLFLVNSTMAAYGFLIVTLCLDRYIAMHRPLYYRHVFTTKKMRWSFIIGSCALGTISCLHWLTVSTISPENEIIDSDFSTTTFYEVWRVFSYFFKYAVPGASMCALTVANIRCVQQMGRAYQEDELRIAGEQSRKHWVHSHSTIARISAILAISYLVFNWPYAIIDYFYTDELADSTAYGIVTLIINVLQVVYIQLNLSFFSYCSATYRHYLMAAVKWPSTQCIALFHYIANRHKRLQKVKEERMSTNTVFTVC